MSTSRSGRGGAPEQRVEDRARDVVRQVRHDVVRRLDEPDEVLVERVALDEPEVARLERARRTDRAGTPRARVSSSTAVTVGPAARRPPVSRPSPGRSRGPGRPGSAPASARIPSSTSMSARKFCDSRWRAPQSGRAERGADVGRIEVRRAAPASSRPRAAATVGRRDRGRTARRPRSGAPRPPRSSRRCPCTGSVAAR